MPAQDADLIPVPHPPAPPPRPADAHKGTFGTVIVVGGSTTMIGAPAICAAAALRSGAGLCKLATPPDILPFAITLEPSATGIPLAGDLDHQLAALDHADPDHRAILAVGPGLGRAEETRDLLLALLRGRRAVVLDADGLNLLADTASPRPIRTPATTTPTDRAALASAANPPLVMTPHPGEFQRLAQPLGITESPTDPDQRPRAAAKLARAHHAVVLLKGRHTIVTDGKRCYTNQTGSPALATAGTGDVLTGITAALLAQRMPPFDAACLAAHLHGLAADHWTAHHGPAGLTAMTLAQQLPDALHALR